MNLFFGDFRFFSGDFRFFRFGDVHRFGGGDGSEALEGGVLLGRVVGLFFSLFMISLRLLFFFFFVFFIYS